MRKPIVAGNWKMNKTAGEARELVNQLRAVAASRADVDVVVAPPATAIAAAAEAAQGSRVAVSGQDLFWKESGAYTGQISPLMLLDLGCRYVIVGHSERRGRFGMIEAGFTREIRALFGDNDATVNLKTRAAHAHGLTPIVCCGELLEERRNGQTDAVVRGQVERGLAGLTAEQAAISVIAYEPVWAIGTGETCEAAEANRVCGVIRASVGELFGEDAAAAVRIQYGGSMKPENAAELLASEHIDGGLVGGASLNAADFGAIIEAAPRG